MRHLETMKHLWLVSIVCCIAMVIPFSTHAGTLETTFTSNHVFSESYFYISTFFDVEVTGSNDVLVNRVSINLDNTDTVQEFRVYTRSGTFRGHEFFSSGWTLVTNQSVTGAGLGNKTSVTFDSITLGSGTTTGFLIAVQKTDGNVNVRDLSPMTGPFSDANLTIPKKFTVQSAFPWDPFDFELPFIDQYTPNIAVSYTDLSPSVITVSKATDFGGGSTSPGTENVRFLQLGVQTDSETANITSVKAKFTGTSTAVNADISAFDVYHDTDGDGEIDGGSSPLGTVSSPDLTNGATVTGLSFGVTTTPKYLLLVLDIAGTADPSHTVGLELTDASFITAFGIVESTNFPIQNALPLAPRALSLDGDGDYVECGKDGSLSITDEMTVEAWVKVSSSFPADLSNYR